MSNAVDILLVDGPLIGMMVCQPRPVPKLIHVHKDGEVWPYETMLFREMVGNRGIPYHIAVRDAVNPPMYATTLAIIKEANFGKAWDVAVTVSEV